MKFSRPVAYDRQGHTKHRQVPHPQWQITPRLYSMCKFDKICFPQPNVECYMTNTDGIITDQSSLFASNSAAYQMHSVAKSFAAQELKADCQIQVKGLRVRVVP